jgi:hypothetical protein
MCLGAVAGLRWRTCTTHLRAYRRGACDTPPEPHGRQQQLPALPLLAPAGDSAASRGATAGRLRPTGRQPPACGRRPSAHVERRRHQRSRRRRRCSAPAASGERRMRPSAPATHAGARCMRTCLRLGSVTARSLATGGVVSAGASVSAARFDAANSSSAGGSQVLRGARTQRAQGKVRRRATRRASRAIPVGRGRSGSGQAPPWRGAAACARPRWPCRRALTPLAAFTSGAATQRVRCGRSEAPRPPARRAVLPFSRRSRLQVVRVLQARLARSARSADRAADRCARRDSWRSAQRTHPTDAQAADRWRSGRAAWAGRLARRGPSAAAVREQRVRCVVPQARHSAGGRHA